MCNTKLQTAFPLNISCPNVQSALVWATKSTQRYSEKDYDICQTMECCSICYNFKFELLIQNMFLTYHLLKFPHFYYFSPRWNLKMKF
jgi:hypothetical protein